MTMDSQVTSARVLSIYRRAPGAVAVTVINAALMAAVLEAEQRSPGPWAWLVVIALLGAARLTDWRAFQRRPEPDAPGSAVGWSRRAAFWAFLSGLAWGLGSAALFPANGVGQWLWVFLIGGMCTGSAVLHGAHPPTVLSYVVPAAAPLAVRLALQDSAPGLAAAFMIVAFVSVTAVTAVLHGRNFGAMVRLQLDLEQRRLELGEINQRLHAEIEQRRTTEASLQQAQKMEALGRLTGGVAHDFNNLLSVITGQVDLIRRRSPDDAAVERAASAALAAAKRGADLTSSLLSFARKQPLQPKTVDLNTLIGEFAPLFRGAAGGKFTVELDLAANLAPVRVDPAHFQSALLNLVINARDAMPDGGRIVIATWNTDRPAADLAAGPGEDAGAGPFVVASVADDGPGMPQDVAARAFDPFFTTKGPDKGSGLGLSQVYGFARQSEGWAGISTGPGKGTTVSIGLPMAADLETRPTTERTAAD